MQKELENIVQQEKALFKEWSAIHPQFSRDGIVDIERYTASDPKVLYILKEVNSKDGSAVDLKDFLWNAGYERKATWDNIARWTHGIHRSHCGLPWADLDHRDTLDKWRRIYLPSIAVLNVKKSPGGHTAKGHELWEVATKDKEFLKEQFDLYNDNLATRPKLVIGCGDTNSSIFCEHVLAPKEEEWKRTNRGVWYFSFNNGASVYIHYAHPEARVADHLLYYGLIDAVREVLKAYLERPPDEGDQ